ncbi:MAG: HypC/HybG/HupF family hydrogenase formation chaperone [Lachnospiraceae bacterium]|jgi:hydrogenase expression/formation protein HypC|nr:HypC/HybG/HupF family hydrogenase formation chaperone [Lachnospiraceae bacterium]MCI1328573.1 HypC/HybG/HupF family hydrogenase formation chaperone [Lachnospiraceae bacterium]
MCVALPGTVLSVDEQKKTAKVSFSGNAVEARTGLVDVKPGDRVLVHAGCVLQKLSGTEAEEIASLLSEMSGSLL